MAGFRVTCPCASSFTWNTRGGISGFIVAARLSRERDSSARPGRSNFQIVFRRLVGPSKIAETSSRSIRSRLAPLMRSSARNKSSQVASSFPNFLNRWPVPGFFIEIVSKFDGPRKSARCSPGGGKIFADGAIPMLPLISLNGRPSRIRDCH